MNRNQLDFLRQNCNKVLFKENYEDINSVNYFILKSKNKEYLIDVLNNAFNDIKIIINNQDKNIFIKRTEEILFLNYLINN